MTTQTPAVVVVGERPQVERLLDTILPDLAAAPETVVVYSASEARDLAARRPVLLLIAPYENADLDGLELTAAVKRVSPTTRVLLTTASNTGNVSQRAPAVGVDYLLFEPVQLFQIEEVLRDALVGLLSVPPGNAEAERDDADDAAAAPRNE
jgi:CheY-like chemotaxis protein